MGLINSEQEYFQDRLEEVFRRLTAQISFGVPVDVDTDGNASGQKSSEMRGTWVTLTLTAATGTATCTHNLNIPVTSIVGGADTANLPNVRWLQFGYEYGDRTGTNAAPAAPAGFSITLLKMSDATVTADAIDLLYEVVGFTPSATEPLSVTLYFIPAVR